MHFHALPESKSVDESAACVHQGRSVGLRTAATHSIGFIAANLCFIKEREQKKSELRSCNCPCATPPRFLWPLLFCAPLLSGSFVRGVWSLRSSRRTKGCATAPLLFRFLHWRNSLIPQRLHLYRRFDGQLVLLRDSEVREPGGDAGVQAGSVGGRSSPAPVPPSAG